MEWASVETEGPGTPSSSGDPVAPLEPERSSSPSRIETSPERMVETSGKLLSTSTEKGVT